MLIKCAELHEPSFFSIFSIRSLTHFQLLVVFKSASTWLQFLPLAKMHTCQVFFEKGAMPPAHGTHITDTVTPRETIKRVPSLDVWHSFAVRYSNSFFRWVRNLMYRSTCDVFRTPALRVLLLIIVHLRRITGAWTIAPIHITSEFFLVN